MNALTVLDVSFDETHVALHLTNGRTLRQTLLSLPPLQKMDANEQSRWKPINDGLGVAWETPEGEHIELEVFPLVWDELCEAALDDLKAANWNLEALSRRKQEIVALWRLEADGYNGGFLQFFCNWGEPTCEIALEALNAMSAHNTLAIVSRQRRLLNRLEDLPEMIAMSEIPGLLTEAERQEISQVLDAQFWDQASEIPRLAVLHYLGEDGVRLAETRENP